MVKFREHGIGSRVQTWIEDVLGQGRRVPALGAPRGGLPGVPGDRPAARRGWNCIAKGVHPICVKTVELPGGVKLEEDKFIVASKRFPHLIHLPLTVTHVADDIMPHHSKHGTPQLPVPEMRFEQKYLSSIAPYIHTEYKPVAERETTLSEEEHLGGAYEKVEVREKQRQLVKETRVQWGRVILRTTFDQVVSPMLQGLVLAVLGHWITPVLQGVRSGVKTRVSNVEGSFSRGLRSRLKLHLRLRTLISASINNSTTCATASSICSPVRAEVSNSVQPNASAMNSASSLATTCSVSWITTFTGPNLVLTVVKYRTGKRVTYALSERSLAHSVVPHEQHLSRRIVLDQSVWRQVHRICGVNRRHTVYDLTALNLQEDGSRLDLDGHLTSRRALAQRSRAVRDARGNVISRSLPVVPRVRRVGDVEGEGEEVELDGEAEKEAEKADEVPVAEPSRKRRRLNQLEDPDLVPSTNELDLPSGDLLKCIHHFASKYYTERGMLLNASKDYRRERKERRKNATRQPTHTPEGDEGEPAVEEEQDEDGHPAVDEQEVDEDGTNASPPPPPTKRRKRGKAYAESSKLTRDMYKVMDGSALMALGLLLQEHVAQTMGLSTYTSAPDRAPKVEETDDLEDDTDEVEEVAVDDWPQPEQTDQLS
ncbi:hypothetical protein K523DRAFT_346035 [Schizophyllum commune Tattone D]|nr:hypothetical protein K523DRAFT_346035 [Schizophyllum commune Tattone D]